LGPGLLDQYTIKRFRSDSAAYQAKIINYSEEQEIEYSITADQDSAVKKAIEAIPVEDWKPLKGREGACIAERERFGS